MYVLAFSSFIGGEYVICKGGVLGPIVARFPRNEEGEHAALQRLKELAGQPSKEAGE